jgi:antagonist of KipI
VNVRVLKPGLLSSLQDMGRHGHAALGIGRAGAMDPPALRLANALVGNAGDEAAIESTLIGPTLRFETAALIALTGARMVAQLDGQALPMWRPLQVPAGSVLMLGHADRGCRSYLAVGGGFAVAPVLGSRSSDLHAHLGRALQADDILPLGAVSRARPSASIRQSSWSLDPRPWFDFHQRPLALLRGSHWSQLDPSSQDALANHPFVLSRDSNRTGGRLDGHILKLREPRELISEATLPGTVQLPPSGQPIVLLAEAPVTGGYPRIGQVAAVDLPRLAQRRPGDVVCFEMIDMNEALTRREHQQRQLARMLRVIAARLQDEGVTTGT